MAERPTIQTTSTSRRTARTDDIVLRVTETSRLIFRPLLVDNPNDPAAAVKGQFIYQRKSRVGEWEDAKDINLSQLKAGEGVSLDLHSGELLKLLTDLRALYDLVGEHGIQSGRTEYVPVRNAYLRELLSDDETREALFSDRGVLLLKTLVDWLLRHDASDSTQRLAELADADLDSIEALLGLARLRRFLETYRANSSNGDEGFWQQLFEDQSWVLSQLFASPFVIVHGSAYVGGKNLKGIGGNLADFLLKNRVTQNPAVTEIKTPVTRLLGPEYRNNVWAPSGELSGGVVQALQNRASLIEDFTSLTRSGERPVELLRPRALLVIGSIEGEGLAGERLRSFEQFRNELRDLDVVTFDELAAKAEALLELLTGPTSPDDSGGDQDADDWIF